jgi:hypothetical protein
MCNQNARVIVSHSPRGQFRHGQHIVDDSFHVLRALNNSFSSVNGGFQNVLVCFLIVGRLSEGFVSGDDALNSSLASID